MANGDEYLKERRKHVTLSTIDKKLAVLCERSANDSKLQITTNEKLDVYVDHTNVRLRTIENLLEITMEKQKDNKEEIDRLRNRSNASDLLLAIGTVVSGFFGINSK
jgi:hypothetical protein